MIRFVENVFNFIKLIILRFLLFSLSWLLNLVIYKRLSKSLVVDRITKRLNMSLTCYRYRKIRSANNEEEKLELLIDDFTEALNKLKSNRNYTVNVNNGIYVTLVRKFRGKGGFEIKVIKEKYKRQMLERSLLMKVSTLFKTLILMKNTENEKLLYKKVKVVELKIFKK